MGLTVEEGNAEELREALIKLINDDELRLEFKKNTMSAKQKYNWEKEKDVLTDLYTKL